MDDAVEEAWLRRIRAVSPELETWCRRQLAAGWSLDEVISRVKRDYEKLQREKAGG